MRGKKYHCRFLLDFHFFGKNYRKNLNSLISKIHCRFCQEYRKDAGHNVDHVVAL